MQDFSGFAIFCRDLKVKILADECFQFGTIIASIFKKCNLLFKIYSLALALYSASNEAS
jgi:hypothetical protein